MFHDLLTRQNLLDVSRVDDFKKLQGRAREPNLLGAVHSGSAHIMPKHTYPVVPSNNASYHRELEI